MAVSLWEIPTTTPITTGGGGGGGGGPPKKFPKIDHIDLDFPNTYEILKKKLKKFQKISNFLQKSKYFFLIFHLFRGDAIFDIKHTDVSSTLFQKLF